MSLTPSQRSDLRAAAHELKPVVIIGDKGLTDEVVAEIDRSLKAHELIKVRAVGDDRKLRSQWMQQICERLEAHPVQQIGKVFVIYRENEEGDARATRRERPVAAPTSNRERLASARDKQREKDERKRKEKEAEEVRAKRTARPRSRTPSPLPESEPRRRRPRTSR